MPDTVFNISSFKNPALRTNKQGRIIEYNKPAEEVFFGYNLADTASITDLFSFLEHILFAKEVFVINGSVYISGVLDLPGENDFERIYHFMPYSIFDFDRIFNSGFYIGNIISHTLSTPATTLTGLKEKMETDEPSELLLKNAMISIDQINQFISSWKDILNSTYTYFETFDINFLIKSILLAFGLENANRIKIKISKGTDSLTSDFYHLRSAIIELCSFLFCSSLIPAESQVTIQFISKDTISINCSSTDKNIGLSSIFESPEFQLTYYKVWLHCLKIQRIFNYSLSENGDKLQFELKKF